jgi:hypothetical protein
MSLQERRPIVLVLTNTNDATADYLCEKLAQVDLDFHRLDTDRAVDNVKLSITRSQLQLVHNNFEFRPQCVSSLWFRRPKPVKASGNLNEPSSYHASMEWAEALEGFLAHIPVNRWINHPSRNGMASHKIEQLSYAARLGLNVPDYIVTNDPDEAMGFIERSHGEGNIVKPLATGYVEHDSGDSIIYTEEFLEQHHGVLAGICDCPVLFQRKVDKVVDVRVTVVDQQMRAVSLKAIDEDGRQRTDIRRNNMEDVEYGVISIPFKVEESIRAIQRHYKLRYAAIDFAVDEKGDWFFFEVNPNGQWAWLDLCTELKIYELFIDTFREDQKSMYV